jgi:hypothetical protein
MTVTKNIRRWLLYFLVVLLVQCAGLSVCGQVRRDSGEMDRRRFNLAELTKFKNDDQFKYRFAAEPPASLWDRFWAWFWTGINRILSTRPGQVTVRILVYAIAVFFIAFFIFQLRKMNSSGLFGTAKPGSIRYAVTDDDINSIDFDAELSRAMEDRNYRLATRIYYLSTLKLLSDQSLIDWQIDKTNISYVKELQANSLKDGFRKLTAYFEKHWYGNIAVSQEEFDQVRSSFETFNRELKS